MVYEYWTSVILLGFQLLSYHYDFFYNEQNMTIFICGDTKSQQATEHLMQSENILLFKIERIFLRFSSVFSLFLPPPQLFLVEKWFWQKVSVMLEAEVRKTDLKDILSNLFFLNRGWITACLSLWLLVLCPDDVNLKFRFSLQFRGFAIAVSLSLA